MADNLSNQIEDLHLEDATAATDAGCEITRNAIVRTFRSLLAQHLEFVKVLDACTDLTASQDLLDELRVFENDNELTEAGLNSRRERAIQTRHDEMLWAIEEAKQYMRNVMQWLGYER